MPVLAEIFTLSNTRPETVASGKPQMMPPFVEPVSGDMSQPVASACAPPFPVSIIAMHGTEDSTVPFSSAQHNDIQTWVRRDACPPQPTSSRLPDTDPSDGTQTSVDTFGPCARGAAVAFYTIEGGGHEWPGG